jgi:hypothetical protein
MRPSRRWSQYPFGKAAVLIGKPPLMLVGLSAFAGLASLCLLLDLEQVSATKPLITTECHGLPMHACCLTSRSSLPSGR